MPLCTDFTNRSYDASKSLNFSRNVTYDLYSVSKYRFLGISSQRTRLPSLRTRRYLYSMARPLGTGIGSGVFQMG